MGTFLRRLRTRIKYWNHERELSKEIETHHEMAAADFSADGTARREAAARDD